MYRQAYRPIEDPIWRPNIMGTILWRPYYGDLISIIETTLWKHNFGDLILWKLYYRNLIMETIDYGDLTMET